MHAALLLVATAAAATSAQLHGLQHHRRQADETDVIDLDAALSSIAAETTGCYASLLDAVRTVPTPAAELLDHDYENVDDICSYSFPNSLTSAFSSYESAVSSWYSAQSSVIDSALSACPEYSSDWDYVTSFCGSATTTTTGTDTPASNAASATATGNSTTFTSVTGTATRGSATSTFATANAGPRETGFIAGVVAAAGFLGAVAAL
jgi:hypothetical protein